MRSAAAALLAAFALAGCGSDPFAEAQRAIHDGSAKAALQARLSRERQCAGLLNGFAPLRVEPQGAALPPGAAALVQLGLIRPVGRASGTTGIGFEPTEAARPHLRTTPRSVELCYGRRQVTGLAMRPRQEGDRIPQLTYRYRIVDVPLWARSPAIARSFPAMPEVLAREHEARDLVLFQDGRWGIGDSGIDRHFPDIALDRQYFAP